MILQIKRHLFHYFSIARYPFYRFFYDFPRVESIEQTLQKILNQKLSIARFGDGELSLLYHNNIGFQNFNEELKKRLQEIILDYNNEKCLIAIPSSIENLDDFTNDAKTMFKSLIGGYYHTYKNFLNIDHVYPNAFITRFYMDLEDKTTSFKYFNLLKQIWNEQPVLIIEGEFTRFGIGNDFLANSTSVSRIIVPSKNAFAHYKEIFETIQQNVSKDTLVLAAIGPTATVLCYDLAQIGYQAIDVGHADIEYEWFLKKSLRKTAINNKAVNEAKNGLTIEIDKYSDEEYLSQIKIRIV